MKQLKSILGLLLIVVGGFVLYKVLPVYWENFKLGQAMEEQARIYTYNGKSTDELAQVVVQKAHDLDISLTEDQVTVEHIGIDLSITAEYTVHVDLPIHPLDLHFKTTARNKKV